MTDFTIYIKQGEPQQKEKALNWQMAIGLQEVDGLKPSPYLFETAKENIEGDITIEEVQEKIEQYYKEKPVKTTEAEKTEEADKVSARITKLLAEKTFSFSPAEYLHIHKKLFTGIYKFAGKVRDYNITKAERVLDGETVYYASFEELEKITAYDFQHEQAFDYTGLDKKQIVEHLADFIAHLWQIHLFGEGNTRTTAVFLIKYLRKLGFKQITNGLFTQHSWYFRNALVRANYEDLQRGIYKTKEYLVRFLSNLLLGEKYVLKNRELHIQFGNSQGGTVNDTVNGTVKLLLSFIKQNPNITIDDLAEKIGKSRRTITRYLQQMKDDGLLIRKGSDKTGQWEIIQW